MRTPTDHDEYDDEDDEEDLDDLNEASGPSFFEKRWWRWLTIAFATLLVLALIVPVVLQAFGATGGNQDPDGQSGAQAPDFTLDSPNHGTVTLSEATAENDYVVLLFYRGYF